MTETKSYPGHTTFNYLGDKVASSIEDKNNIISFNFKKERNDINSKN